MKRGLLVLLLGVALTLFIMGSSSMTLTGFQFLDWGDDVESLPPPPPVPGAGSQDTTDDIIGTEDDTLPALPAAPDDSQDTADDTDFLPPPPTSEEDELDLPAAPIPPSTHEPERRIPVTRTGHARDLLSSAPSFRRTTNGSTQEQIDELASEVATLKFKMRAVELMPAWEERLNTVEQQEAIATGFDSQLGSYESRLSTVEVSVRNLEDRPSLDSPAVVTKWDQILDALDTTNRGLANANKRSITSTVLSTIALIMITGMMVTMLILKKHNESEDKQRLGEYIHNYSKAGYSSDTLRSHLRASGWSDKVIDDAIKEYKPKR